jgi:ArsR family transcriptional regulator, arsenate/arsenite/antimonite-responsive transcriptional repressor
MKLLKDTFKALSDETRLQIMTLLLEQEELCVCDFVGALGQTQSKVSRHLRYLYNAGLVQDRREGLWMHYRISTHLKAEQATVLAALSEAVSVEQKRNLSISLKKWFARKEADVGPQDQQGAAACG